MKEREKWKEKSSKQASLYLKTNRKKPATKHYFILLVDLYCFKSFPSKLWHFGDQIGMMIDTHSVEDSLLYLIEMKGKT